MAYYATEGRKINTLPETDVLEDNDTLLFYEDGEYKALDLSTLKSSSSGIIVEVAAPEGSTVTVSDGNIAITKEGAETSFELPDYGTWTVTGVKGTSTASETLVVNIAKRYRVTLEYAHIYGISRNQSSSSPEWTRTDEAVGKTATASVGNVTIGHSDFDNCYPWSEMKRVTMSTGDVMVYIPEFYYKRVVDSNGVETIQIASDVSDGFEKHPGSGKYIGAYLLGQYYKSISGTSPLVYQTRSSARTSIRAKGDGWQMFTVAIYSAIEMLYLVEFANSNTQSIIGSGWSASRSYDVNTGSCDSMTYLTGASSNSYANSEAIYRGIEGLWGNSWEILDGVNLNSTTCYVCLDPENFADGTATNYNQISETINASTSYVYSNAFIYDPNFPWVMLPTIKAGVSASSTTGGTCDIIYVSSGWNYPAISSSHDNSDWCGLFAFRTHPSANTKWISSRLVYYPSLDLNHTTTIQE